jgi:Fe-S cluster assembly protein SufD
MDAVNKMMPWREAFDAFAANDESAEMGRQARSDAFARFEAHGLPTRRHEYWKYTPVRDLQPDHAAPDAVAADPFSEIDAYRMIFVDGRIDMTRSDREALAGLVDVAGPEGAPWMEGVFGTLQNREIPGAMFQVERPFADLNMAMFTDGLAVRIPAGVTVDKPIHLRYEGTLGAHLRLEMLVEEGASVTVLESGSGALTTGAEVVIADEADFHHLRSQTEVGDTQFTALYARVGKEASFKSFTLCADGALIRNETIILMAGDNGSGHVAAGIMGNQGTLIDNTVYVSHEAEHCESRQVFKSVLDGDAKSVFQGKIYVREGAQKTDGYQMSQAVLLSERAEFNAKPELEIYADDVLCSHGSTTGALDEDAKFYLRSRGCTERESEALLVAAFIDEAIMEIADEALQEKMRDLTGEWMAARARAD